MAEIKIKGQIFTGVMRGYGIINYHFYRIVGQIGFEPFKGTLNVKLERQIDMSHFATKSLEHVLVDGSKRVDALLAPIILTIKKTDGNEIYDCWAMRDMSNVYPEDVIEIIGKENITDKFSLKGDEEVIVTFYDTGYRKKKKEPPFMGAMRKLYGPETRVSV